MRRQFSTRGGPARLVETHGTFCDGLIPLLRSLQGQSGEYISTIVPGRLMKTRGKSRDFSLLVKQPRAGGFRAVARKGSTAQEVYFRTKLSKDELQNEIASALEKHQKKTAQQRQPADTNRGKRKARRPSKKLRGRTPRKQGRQGQTAQTQGGSSEAGGHGGRAWSYLPPATEAEMEWELQYQEDWLE